TAKEAWEILKEEFQGSDRIRVIRLLNLRRDLANLKMKKSENVNDFVFGVMKIVNKMKIYGEKFEDKEIVEKVLISLIEKFHPKIAAIEESKDLSKLTVSELLGSLEA
ncbi:UBN2 domain-containing protein, partial [Cephalotus follicularis]